MEKIARRLTSHANGANQIVGFRYDMRGNATEIVYPGSTGGVTRTFDDAGRLWKVKDWLSNETVFGYDADSFLTRQTYPNGKTASFTPDAADRLMGVSHAPTAAPNSPFTSFGYGRDNANQLSSVTSTGAISPCSPDQCADAKVRSECHSFPRMISQT
jgi:YD repeat-containing protein